MDASGTKFVIETEKKGKALSFIMIETFISLLIMLGIMAGCLYSTSNLQIVSGICIFRNIADISSSFEVSEPESIKFELTNEGIELKYFAPSLETNTDKMNTFIIRNPALVEKYNIVNEPYQTILLLVIVASCSMLIFKLFSLRTQLNKRLQRWSFIFSMIFLIISTGLFFATFLFTASTKISYDRFDEAYEKTIDYFNQSTFLAYPYFTFELSLINGIENWKLFTEEWKIGGDKLILNNKSFNCNGTVGCVTDKYSSKIWRGRPTLKENARALYEMYKYEIDILTHLEEKYRCAGWNRYVNNTFFTQGCYQSLINCRELVMSSNNFEIAFFGYTSALSIPLIICAIFYFSHLLNKIKPL